jgi:hypothetical protein
MRAARLVVLAGMCCVATAAATAAPPLAIVGVTVIDGTGAPAAQDRTVLVAANRITTVGDSATTAPPEGARIVDGRGKFLIPGLWDMHVHGTANPMFPLMYVANGVTGVRDMFGPLDELGPVRDAIASGARIGPRIVAAGRIIDGPKPVWPGSLAVATESEGRAAVHTVQKEGSDFVKVYSLLPRPAYFAIADEARKLGMTFAGHVPDAVTAAEASEAGQGSLEHLLGVACGCAARGPGTGEDSRPYWHPARVASCLSTYDVEKARALFATFRRNHTWQCPTLTVLHALATLDHTKRAADPRLAYLPAGFRAFWDPRNDFRFKNLTASDYAVARKVFRRELALVGAMQGAGVEMLAGTDAMNPYCFPGFGLHDELAWLVRAGLTPLEALQAATRNPARFLGRERDLGTVEAGKIADLVLLDADPLVNIRNSTTIRAVVLGGVLLDRATLDGLLADARRMAGAAPAYEAAP